MMNSKDNNTDSKQEIMAALCGATVITHYNRKTYRVDDVDFTMNPLSTFDQHGVQVSNIHFNLFLHVTSFFISLFRSHIKIIIRKCTTLKLKIFNSL